MMSTSLLKHQNYFGLFELDESGTVLYAKIEPSGRRAAKAPDTTGQNFFKEIVPFENAEELRQRVARFDRNGVQADNFIFNCRINGAFLPVRVLLARVRENADGNQTKSILLHIRKSSPGNGIPH